MITLRPSLEFVSSRNQSAQIVQIKTAPVRILVAEDDKANQMVTSLWLQEFGYDHEIADDGEKTVEKFKTGKFSIILMDIGMNK